MITYDILSFPLEITNEETCYGINTVFILDKKIYYLGDIYPGLDNIIKFWETEFGITFSDAEIDKIILENYIKR